MHHNRGKTILKCLSERTDYAMDGEKTARGDLISSFECTPETAAAEFALSKQIYFQRTGREQEHDIIAYQLRQSFKPGEVTAEEANRIGYEFAERFLKGKHAFIVCTHINRHHIHNHIIWNSTTLDCDRKFRNFWYSTNAVRKLSDLICIEHGLSVIEKPGRKGLSYDKWLGNKAKPSNREIVRIAIDEILNSKPKDIYEFIRMLEDKGFKIKRGRHLTLAHPDFKKSIRMDSLGDGYTEEDIQAIIAGTKQLVQRRHRDILAPEKNSLLIDIEAKLSEGKGGGYEHWAKVHNLKQMAQTINYLREHGLLDLNELQKRTSDVTVKYHELSDKIKSAEARIKEISELRMQIINYSKTREIFAAYKKSGYSKSFLAEHEQEILLHKTAKKAFDDLKLQKLPTVKSLNDEFAELVRQKKSLYSEYSLARDEMRELLIHKSNVEKILGIDENLTEKKPGHER
jgi:hypothetical protein